MNYKKFSFYVQRQMNKLLRELLFVKTYMNDIVIFSHILNEHLVHLLMMFKLLRNKKVSLTLIKFFVNYSSIILLNQ